MGLVNDGATCMAPDEAALITYYETSMARKNCVLVPFGPAPLMAYVTTRDVRDGEELLTTYGCEYWLNEIPDASERLEATPDVLTLVRQTAASILLQSSTIARNYAKDIAQLKSTFAQ